MCVNMVRDICTFDVLFSVHWPFILQSLVALDTCGVYTLLRLISIARYVFKSQSIAFRGTKFEIFREDVLK